MEKLSQASIQSLENNEDVSRLLFYDQMIDAENRLQKSAFPMGDILEENNRSLSVDRCMILGRSFHDLLARKSRKYADANKGRAEQGYCLAATGHIRSIQGDSKEQLFDVLPDPIERANPDPWDSAHAKLICANPKLTKGYLRGYRDKLCDLFSERIHLFR